MILLELGSAWGQTYLRIPPKSKKKRLIRTESTSFYGCGGRTRTCGLRVMSCSEAPIPCNARVLRILYPQKSRKTRRPTVFIPRPTNGLLRKWVGIWVRENQASQQMRRYRQRRENIFLLCMILVFIDLSSTRYHILPSFEHRVKLFDLLVCMKNFCTNFRY